MRDEQEQDKGTIARIREVATDNSAITALAVGGLVAGVMSGHLEMPPWAIDIVLGGGVAGLIGYVVGGKIAERFSEPPEVEEVVEVDAERDVAQTWFVPPEGWEDRREEDGSPWFRTGSENWGVRELGWDDEQDVAVVEQAPLRSELTDDELETWHSAVYQTRGELRDDAREGAFIKARLPAIGQSIEYEVWDALARMRAEKRNIKPQAVFGKLDEELGDVKSTLDKSDEDEAEKVVREVLKEYSDEDVDPGTFEQLDEQDFENFTPEQGGENR